MCIQTSDLFQVTDVPISSMLNVMGRTSLSSVLQVLSLYFTEGKINVVKMVSCKNILVLHISLYDHVVRFPMYFLLILLIFCFASVALCCTVIEFTTTEWPTVVSSAFVCS